ncbi:uncharacterized protein LOC125824263 [Solanum verrucosum]|uniref:uncharacterized protein LOC125824263 n=1 Tax=Solanum verrucosum TaxID=315347 RepID=UPI0020D03C98|nr:uncharacterized protein LOC125824263 [Solanum verrucosum]
MNPLTFTSSSITEDPVNFVEELKKMFEVIHVADAERVELDSYQLKGVSRIRFDQWKKGRSRGAPIVTWGSVAQKGNGTSACVKCGRTHSGVCHDGSTGYFKCGQEDYFMKEFPKNRQCGGNRSNRAQSSSVAPPDKASPREATSGIAIGENYLYAITSRQEQKNFPNVVTRMIKVLNIDVYSLLDPRVTLFYISQYCYEFRYCS